MKILVLLFLCVLIIFAVQEIRRQQYYRESIRSFDRMTKPFLDGSLGGIVAGSISDDSLAAGSIDYDSLSFHISNEATETTLR